MIEKNKCDKSHEIKSKYKQWCKVITVTLKDDFTVTVDGSIKTYSMFKLAYDAAKFENTDTIKFRNVDNVVHSVTIDEFLLLINKLAVYANDAWNKKITLQAQIDSATTIEEVQEITW